MLAESECAYIMAAPASTSSLFIAVSRTISWAVVLLKEHSSLAIANSVSNFRANSWDAASLAASFEAVSSAVAASLASQLRTIL
jgi:hypothetical protein